MKRREFLAGMAGAAVLNQWSWAADLPSDMRITRVVAFDLISKRSKFVGKNSRLDDHGDRASDRMVWLYTNAGIEGLGNCRADKKSLAPLLGGNPFDFYKPSEWRMGGPLGPGTMPLWDLAGKVLKKPVYELLGGSGPARVPVYDGSIYFSDLMPQHADRPMDRFKEEIDMGIKRGHRAFKVKVGRGAKWMPREAGDARDVEVLKAIRQHAGPEIIIGIDANNGYDLPRTKRLLEQLPDYDFAWLEEMFPETVEQCLDLKKFIADHKWETLVADGESQGDLEAFKPYVDARAIDVLQGDINRFGIDGIMTEAAMAKAQGLMVAPHNWGSLVGFYMQVHVGRAITNLYRAEQDPLSNDVLIAEGYEIRDGACSVPKAPGFGIKIDESKFSAGARIQFDLKV